MNWLFAFVPAALVLEHTGAPAPWVFFAAALAIVPVARLIVRSTEQLATYTGDAVGGLLNATFGNAPELIIALVALQRGPARHGARVDRRRDPRQPAARPRHRVPARRPALPHADLQRGRGAALQLDDAGRGGQPDGAELLQPLLRARGDPARGGAAQRRPRRGAARRLRPVSRVHAEDSRRGIQGGRRRMASTRARAGAWHARSAA